ncbi:MAG: hypothetical protein VX699_03900, partial [Myxococcota bacterium]|nr:hypothetical protein [Myxococcota bacterium]
MSTQVVLKDSAVRDIQLDGTVGEGFGVSIQDARASLERVSINNVYNFGLTALSSTLDLKDIVIENIMSFSKSEEKGYGGIAVVATTVTGEGLVVRGSENVGIGGWSNSVFRLSDVVVTDSIGPGIFFVDSRAEVSKMEVHNIEEDAMVLSNASLELERFRVFGVRGSQEIDNGTNAITALNGSELNAYQGILENEGETTLYFSKSSGALADLSIQGKGNVGLSIRDASLVDAERVLIKGKTFGVIVGPAWRKNTRSYANLTHIRIEGARGYGIRTTDSLVAGRRIHVSKSPVGLVNQGAQGIIMLEEVEFSEGTLESALDPYSQNAYLSGGIGMLAHKGSRTILSTSRLHHNRTANLVLAGDYTIAELDNTRLEHAPDEALKKVVRFEIGGKTLTTGSRKTFERYGIATFDKSRLTSKTETPEKPKKKLITARAEPAGKKSAGALTGAALGISASSNEAPEEDLLLEEDSTIDAREQGEAPLDPLSQGEEGSSEGPVEIQEDDKESGEPS